MYSLTDINAHVLDPVRMRGMATPGAHTYVYACAMRSICVLGRPSDPARHACKLTVTVLLRFILVHASLLYLMRVYSELNT